MAAYKLNSTSQCEMFSNIVSCFHAAYAILYIIIILCEEHSQIVNVQCVDNPKLLITLSKDVHKLISY